VFAVNVGFKALLLNVPGVGNPIAVFVVHDPKKFAGLLCTPLLLLLFVTADQSGGTKNFLLRFVHCLDLKQTLQVFLL